MEDKDKYFLICRGYDETICCVNSELEAGKLFSVMTQSSVYSSGIFMNEESHSEFDYTRREFDLSLVDLVENILKSLKPFRDEKLKGENENKNNIRMSLRLADNLVNLNRKRIESKYLGNLAYENTNEVVEKFDCSVFAWFSEAKLWYDKD